MLSQRLHAAPRTRANRDGRSLSPNAHDRWAGARVALVARTVSVLPTRGCASRRASAAENGAWAIVASGQGTKQRRAVGSDRNHPVPGPCCSRVGALVGKGAARAGRAAIRTNVRFGQDRQSSPREQSGEPVESRLRARPGCTCEVSRTCDVLTDREVACSDDRGDSARRQEAPAPNRSRSRTGACAEKRRARCCRGRTRHRSGTAPTRPPSPQPHAPLATRSARYTRSSFAPAREVRERAYPQHPAP